MIAIGLCYVVLARDGAMASVTSTERIAPACARAALLRSSSPGSPAITPSPQSGRTSTTPRLRPERCLARPASRLHRNLRRRRHLCVWRRQARLGKNTLLIGATPVPLQPWRGGQGDYAEGPVWLDWVGWAGPTESLRWDKIKGATDETKQIPCGCLRLRRHTGISRLGRRTDGRAYLHRRTVASADTEDRGGSSRPRSRQHDDQRVRPACRPNGLCVGISDGERAQPPCGVCRSARARTTWAASCRSRRSATTRC